ncbi:MAG: hypothetical protein ACTSU2_03215 [Promethearchaeota archaeon]
MVQKIIDNKPGDRRIKGLKISRLLVLLSIIFVPIGTFFIFNSSMRSIFRMDWVPVEWRDIILNITPWVYTISWVFMLVLFANRIAGTFDIIDSNFSVIPNRLKIFYGINAIVVMIIFVFPLLTPVVGILAFASFGYRLGVIGHDWDKYDYTPRIAYILAVIFSIIPLFISVAVIPDMLAFSEKLWAIYWLPLINPLYKFSMDLCTALTIGSLVILVKTGVTEYEQIESISHNKDLNLNWVKGLEVLLFLLFIFMEWKKIEFIKAFYYAGFIIVIFITFVNFMRGRAIQKDFRSYSFGYILTIILLGANTLSLDQLGFGEMVKNISLIVSALMYIVLTIIVFLKYNEED